MLPRAIRERRGWSAGVELIVEERPEGVLLRPAKIEKPSRMEDVAGCLGLVDRVVSIEEMNSAVDDDVRKRWGHEYDDLD